MVQKKRLAKKAVKRKPAVRRQTCECGKEISAKGNSPMALLEAVRHHQEQDHRYGEGGYWKREREGAEALAMPDAEFVERLEEVGMWMAVPGSFDLQPEIRNRLMALARRGASSS